MIKFNQEKQDIFEAHAKEYLNDPELKVDWITERGETAPNIHLISRGDNEIFAYFMRYYDWLLNS